jgi:uncharacterized protein YjbI with pentapeptide repeats
MDYDVKRFEIKNRYTGIVIYSSTKTNYKDVLEEAIENGADLSEADLRGADLSGAELQNAKFCGKGGITKIKRNQVDDFLRVLGIIVEE